ncbi:MAG: phospho-N-acetylmuramoyl-pentapeptide-transferase [Marinilabiliaceae bacterium]|nr:phospho-N-acetylmuramoyl-pentapeptide-transferase [Marinilabiliaceae bacterium]
MLYYLFVYLKELGLPGAGLFQYISFRAGLAVILSLIMATVIGRKIINLLQRQQIGETIRDLGLEGQMQKKGTPTMGGIIIIASILLPVLLLSKLDNVYVILMIVTTLWMGAIGFVDDYIKVFRKNKEGMAGRFKILGQVGLGVIVALTLWMNSDVVVRETVPSKDASGVTVVKGGTDDLSDNSVKMKDYKAPVTSIPFFKKHIFDYRSLIPVKGESQATWGWLLFVLVVIFVVTAVSNGANMTDGLDGLAAGTSAIIGTTLGIIAYVSSHIDYANYLNIFYIPNSSELVVYMAAFIGATIGFLWYNSFPAQVFMGDTGSLTLGGIIGVFSIMIRVELLLPILCGIFLVENVSVMLQVGYFKYTKRKFGEGRRIFLMAPLHHHYQKKGIVEPKIVTRFWLVGIILAIVTLVTLKVR